MPWLILSMTYPVFELPLVFVSCFVYVRSCTQVPCVAVVENMCHFDADGKRYYPFGRGSGSQACFSDYILFGLLVTMEGQRANPRVNALVLKDEAYSLYSHGVLVLFTGCPAVRNSSFIRSSH